MHKIISNRLEQKEQCSKSANVTIFSGLMLTYTVIHTVLYNLDMEAETNLHVVIMFCLLHLFTFGLVFVKAQKSFKKLGKMCLVD